MDLFHVISIILLFVSLLRLYILNGLQDYIHRVGRTARAGRSGVAISLVNQYELEWYLQIEKLIGRDLSRFAQSYAFW